MPGEHPEILIGTSGWTYDHWKGVFYPVDLPKSHWLAYYIANFQTVEINATFYRPFKDQVYHGWWEKAPEGFVYVLKAPRIITHRKYLEHVEQDIEDFWRSANLLEDKLGLILLQVAPGTPFDLNRLRLVLLAFGDPHKVAVEFRHKDWYSDEVRRMLEELGVTFCNADSPRNKLTGWVTSQSAYIRLHGRKRWYSYDYSTQELEEIAEMIREMVGSGARRVYVFFNNDFEGNAPRNALELMGILGDEA